MQLRSPSIHRKNFGSGLECETKYEIRFNNLGELKDLKLVAFENASPANKVNFDTVVGSIQFNE